MDGALSPVAGLPPIAGAPAPGYPGVPRQAPPANPVGRPAGDPDVQEARVARHAERKRLESVLPKQATDSKIQIYKIKGGRPIPNARPVMTILLSDLEKAKAEGAGDDADAADAFIAGKIAEKYDGGKFQCVVHDKLGKKVTDVPPWIVSLDEDDDGEDDDDPEEEIDDQELQALTGGRGFPSYSGDARFPGAPFAGGQAPYPPAPPAPPAMDIAPLASALRTERNDEARRSTEMMTIVTAMMQNSQQQQQLMLQQQQARDEQYRREAIEREERSRKEAAEREERAEKRRGEFRQTLMTMTPLLMPFIEKIFGLGKKAEGPDAMTAMLLEMVKQKSPDSDIMKQMAGVMAEMTKQQMQLQGSGAQAAVDMQARASGVVFENMLKTMKELMANQSPLAAQKEDSTLEQILKVAAPLLANMQQNQPAQPMPQPAAPQQRAEPQAADGQVVEAPRKRAPPRGRPAAAAAPQAPPAEQHTPAQRIRGSLHVLRRMTTTGEGAIPPMERWAVLDWVRQTVPDDVKAAIAAGDKEQVILLCSSAAISDLSLLNWLKDTDNVAFVEDAIADIRALMEGKVTEEHAKKAIEAQVTFLARRVNAAQASVAATAGAATGAVAEQAAATAAGAPPPIAGPGSKPDAEGTKPPVRPRARRAPPAAQPPADPGTPPAAGG